MNKNTLKAVIFATLFAIPFVPFLISSQLFFPFITSKAFVWRILVEVAFATWVILAATSRQYRPKKSLLLYNIGAFLLIIFLADIFGVAPLKSFWSNFERMEGFITMLHLGALFIVAGSVFKEEDWRKWWNTNLLASAIMVVYALFQVLGAIKPSQSDARVDGTFGNAIYLAVYMLFNIFITIYLAVREWKNQGWRWLYGSLILFQVLILYYTATRGAILGLFGGLIIFALLNLKNKEVPQLRKASLGVILAILALVGLFFSIRHTDFVTKSPVLSRFASLSPAELKTQGRFFIWPMALKGIAERPILGWGQDNFNYIFQKYYTPQMYILEPWFDRAHNIFLDWAVAGGVLGLLFYLSFYAVALYLIWLKDKGFTYVEKTVLTSLLAAYFFHNFFVFDHLLSYVLFFSFLSYLHFRNPLPTTVEVAKDENRTAPVWVLPVVAVGLILTLYYTDYKPWVANYNLINALESIQLGKNAETVTYFEKAYKGSRLGHEEIVEQMVTHSSQILSSSLTQDEKNNFALFVKDAVVNLVKDNPKDARYQIMAGTFFDSAGDPNSALPYLEKARELAPNKQQVSFELGAAYFNLNKPVEGLAEFKKVYDQTPEYPEAKTIYFIGSIYAGDRKLESTLLQQLDENTLVFDSRIISAYYAKQRIAEVMAILERRIQLDPANSATYQQYIDQIKASTKK